jgi:hypothetical protein
MLRQSRIPRAVSAVCAVLLSLGGVQALVGALALLAALSDHGHSFAAARDRGHLDLVLRHSAAGAHDHAEGSDLHASDAHEHVVHLGSEEPARERTRQAGPSALLAYASSAPASVNRFVCLFTSLSRQTEPGEGLSVDGAA